jgi:hypothetical protein
MMMFHCLLDAKTRRWSLVSSWTMGTKVYGCMTPWTVCSETSAILEKLRREIGGTLDLDEVQETVDGQTVVDEVHRG